MIKKVKIKVGSRASRLARVQVEEFFRLLKRQGVNLPYEPRFYKTAGDKDRTTPLSLGAADDFFTDTLDAALLADEIDLAIHSAKDLPQELPEGLDIFVLTEPVDTRDAFVGKVNLSRLPPGAAVGASSVLRQAAVRQINSKVKVVDVRGTIEERLALLKRGAIDGLIVAACALKRLGLANRIKEIMPWQGSPLQGQLAAVGRAGDLSLKNILAKADIRKKYGRVFLVGAGPGDPKLITVKGIEALKEADCVFYDYLAHRDLLNYAKRAEKIYVGKRKGEHALPQAELSGMLKEKALAGKTVVRLKGGDPLIFGRGADEILYLRAYHIPVTVIPGVSSATAIPSSLAVPLTARGSASSVAFVSGHDEREGRGGAAAKALNIPAADTIVFLMGLTKVPQIVRSLKKKGFSGDTPVLVVSKGTTPEEKIVEGTLNDIEAKVVKAHLEPPALIVAGSTVKFFKKEPPRGILYLGTHPEKYRGLGEIVPFPMIRIAAAPIEKPLARRILKELRASDWVILTSPHAVRHFFAFVKKNKFPADHLKDKDFAVIGEATAAALAKFKIIPKVKAALETSQGLFRALKSAANFAGKKVLFPRSALPNPFLKNELTKLGAQVREFAVYINTKPQKTQLPLEKIQAVFFTSPSAVKNFLEDYAAIPEGWQILSRGPLTCEVLREAGYNSEILD